MAFYHVLVWKVSQITTFPTILNYSLFFPPSSSELKSITSHRRRHHSLPPHSNDNHNQTPRLRSPCFTSTLRKLPLWTTSSPTTYHHLLLFPPSSTTIQSSYQHSLHTFPIRLSRKSVNRKPLSWFSRRLSFGTRTIGQNQIILRHRVIHCPMSLGVSEQANEWAQRSAQAKQAVWSERMSERCKWISERTSEWPSTYVSNHGCSEPLWPGS